MRIYKITEEQIHMIILNMNAHSTFGVRNILNSLEEIPEKIEEEIENTDEENKK